MTTINRWLRAMVLLVLLVGVAPPAVLAKNPDQTIRVNLRIDGESINGELAASARGGGQLHGDISGNLAVLVIDPAPGSPPIAQYDVVATTTVTAPNGTVTLTFIAPYDPATGDFSGDGTIVSGTGKFEGATGTITVAGTYDFNTGALAETITGSMIVP